MHRQSKFVLLLLYVDDVLLASNVKTLATEIANKISSRFRVSTEGSIENYLGIEINIKLKEQKVYSRGLQYLRAAERIETANFDEFDEICDPALSIGVDEDHE